jgi:hypothetical protein
MTALGFSGLDAFKILIYTLYRPTSFLNSLISNDFLVKNDLCHGDYASNWDRKL